MKYRYRITYTNRSGKEISVIRYAVDSVDVAFNYAYAHHWGYDIKSIDKEPNGIYFSCIGEFHSGDCTFPFTVHSEGFQS